MTLDERADLLRLAHAERMGLRLGALIPFRLLSDPEREMWRQRARQSFPT